MDPEKKKKKRLRLVIRNTNPRYGIGFHPDIEDEPADQEEAVEEGGAPAPSAPAGPTMSLEEVDELSWGDLYDYREFLSAEVEEFYNQDHDPDTGRFDVGSDGPGRKRENSAKSEQTIGSKAPQWMKDMLSRKRGAAVKQGADLLPKNAPQYMKDMMKRKMEESVVHPKTPRTQAKPKVETTTVPVSQTDKGGTINRIDAAEIMHGTDSKEHKAAKAKFGPKELKSESSGKHPASDYAYVPEGDKSSGWKLRLTSKPGGKPDARIVGAAVAALGAGFRGHKVQIPEKDRPKVIAKVRAAWLSANKDKTVDDLPSVLKVK